MSSDSSAEPSTGRFYFRGQERIDVIENLARKELTLAAIATKYGRGHDTLRQFSARNHAEILRRRRELQGELNAATVDHWVSEKAQLGDLYWKHYEDIDARLSDPSLDDRAVARLTRVAESLVYKYSELMGMLPPHTSKVEVARSVLTDFDVIAMDENGDFHGVVDGPIACPRHISVRKSGYLCPGADRYKLTCSITHDLCYPGTAAPVYPDWAWLADLAEIVCPPSLTSWQRSGGPTSEANGVVTKSLYGSP